MVLSRLITFLKILFTAIIFTGCIAPVFKKPMPINGTTLKELPNYLEGIHTIHDDSNNSDEFVSIEEIERGLVSLIFFEELTNEYQIGHETIDKVRYSIDTVKISSLRNHKYIRELIEPDKKNRKQLLPYYVYNNKKYVVDLGEMRGLANFFDLTNKGRNKGSNTGKTYKKNVLKKTENGNYFFNVGINGISPSTLWVTFKLESDTLSGNTTLKFLALFDDDVLKNLTKYLPVDEVIENEQKTEEFYVVNKKFDDESFFNLYKKDRVAVPVKSLKKVEVTSTLAINKPSFPKTSVLVDIPDEWEGLYVKNDKLISVDKKGKGHFSIMTFSEILKEDDSETLKIKSLFDHDHIKQKIREYGIKIFKHHGIYYQYQEGVYNVDYIIGENISILKGQSTNEYLFLFPPSKANYWHPIQFNISSSTFNMKRIEGNDIDFRNQFDFRKDISEKRTGIYVANDMKEEELFNLFENEKLIKTEKFVKVPEYSISVYIAKATASLFGFILLISLIISNNKYRKRIREHSTVHGEDVSYTASNFGTNQLLLLLAMLVVIGCITVFIIYFPNLEAYIFEESLIDSFKQ